MQKSLCVLLLALCGCTDARWAQLSGTATRTYLSRENVGAFGLSDCETKSIGDWAYEVRCADNVTYVRCGYHRNSSCCWRVESANAATALFGKSGYLQRDRVCETHWAGAN